MANSLEKAEKYAREYADCEQDAWAQVKQQHDQAMAVMDVEDLVDHGVFVLSMWIRHAEQWHEYVSQDIKRYNEESHKKLNEVESLAARATVGTIKLINHVKKWGFEIAKEGDLLELAQHLLGAASEPEGQFQDRTFARFRQKSLKEYKSGHVEEIEHWGQ